MHLINGFNKYLLKAYYMPKSTHNCLSSLIAAAWTPYALNRLNP